ncbi:bidirectional sugar transporter SWEET9-like [Nicotiana tabacum]|uniref:Bidirectional sugar transporter SWEET n=2 Tax=Nicotiana tabacum TaxID=4097 RepID=A0A1S3ZYG4_TOBAC|nr:bidirectional sugar transporter SWEET11-like [Nicotiana tomentosiformis]XP_016433510.1 PREDICTED: bidirectional sugar transporter SWEET11-like isoform X2 [Nicotiana tabacum]
MAGISVHVWASAFGVLGDIVSFIVFLSPLPTFYTIYKKKSTEGYQSIPYVVALFSCILWIYYALLMSNMIFIITINTFGCFIETIYVGFYLFYAPKKARVQTVKMLLLLVLGGFGAIVLVTQFLFKGAVRGQIVGWICLVFSLCTFAAPLCIVRKVIKTKSVEYMPFLLSFFLTLSAVMWFFYGLLIKDKNVAIPNILGFIFGILQMILYVIYNKKEKNIIKEQKLRELQNHVVISEEQKNLPQLTEEQIIDIVKLGALVYSEKFNARGPEAAKVENMPKLQTVQV